LEVIESESNITPVSLLKDNELVSIVIEKHEKLIKEFTDELNELEKKVELNQSEYNKNNEELDSLETRIVVLGEKRHQLYHQSRKLRTQLTSSLKDMEGVMNLEKEMDKIENRLQYTKISSAEEINYIGQLQSLIKQLGSKNNIQEAHKNTISSIIDILETARSTRNELDGSINTPDKLKTNYNSLKNEFEEMDSRCGWLRRRLEQHGQALKYWGKVQSGVEQLE
jgi:chromosome segregation ATPase